MGCEERIQIEKIIKREEREKRLKFFLESYIHILKIKYIYSVKYSEFIFLETSVCNCLFFFSNPFFAHL